MTFTFIIMDSLYIMRNLLILFCLMVVFWTNLGNCAGSCDRYTQCHYNETRMRSTVSCNIETARGNTAPPCYGDGSIITCSCNNENHQLSSPDNSYLCKPDEWEDGLYDLYCLSFCDKYTQCHYDETWVHSTVNCTIETAGDTAPPCYGDGSNITCSCKNENYQLSSPDNSYLCRPDKWEHGLYDLYCLPSPCDEPAPSDVYVFHSPDFAEGVMYPNGTEIMYDCPDGFDLNGNTTAVCLYGVWTYEDANCTASPCDEPAPPNDLVFHNPDFAEEEMYAHGTEIMYDCPDGYYLIGNRTAVCLYGVWTHGNAFCKADCAESTDCKSEQISACDKETRSCACPPGKTFQNAKCLVERIIRSSLQLEVEYKNDFADKSSRTLEQDIRTVFEETFTRLGDNNGFFSCEVEAIKKLDVDILVDVVTRYGEDVAVVTAEDFDTHIQSKAQSGLRLKSMMSKKGSYNACKEGTDICDPENGDCIYHSGTNYECRCKMFTTDRNQGNPALHGIECDPFPILLVIIIATYTLLFAVLLIWLVKKYCLRRGTKWIPSVEGVANEQVPPTANDESNFVSKVTFEMRDPNAYQNDVNKEENDVTDHVGDNSPDDSPNNDPKEETV